MNFVSSSGINGLNVVYSWPCYIYADYWIESSWQHVLSNNRNSKTVHWEKVESWKQESQVYHLLTLGKINLLALVFSSVKRAWGAWVAQPARHWTWTQVMISQFVNLSLALESVRTALILLWILCLPTNPTPLLHMCSLCLSKINK